MLNIKKLTITIMSLTALFSTIKKCSAETFSLIALPDTQFYASYSDPRYYQKQQNPFYSQTKWIVNNTQKENIAFTMHLGDLVDNSTDPQQWQLTSDAMKVLDDNSINYGICRGNHDAFEDESFIRWFGPDRFKDSPTYKASGPNGFNSYHIFTADERQFLVIFCDWRMEQDELEWVKSVLQNNSQYPTIIVSHQILSVDGKSPASPKDTDNSVYIWNELVKDNNQVFLTISGHHHGTAWRVDKNAAGNDVLQMVVDYQMSFANGAGYMRQLTFDTEANTITAKTFSPWISEVAANKIKLPPYVIPEIKTPDASFTIKMDLSQRFNK